jgi:hypothetical protein
VDLDGDGTNDILSGSWPGELYFFRGEGKGKFAAPETIKDKDGKVINPGRASTVFACDWNGDGALDLVMGNIDGHVQVALNEGGSKTNAFGKPQQVKFKSEAIKVNHGDSHPVVADWDNDGKPDLLVGAGDGGVLWYRNVGSRKEPKFESARVLLDGITQPQGDGKPKGGQRGYRAKICVTDWNGDGQLDLLVGDFNMSYGEKPKLSDADKAAEKAAQEKYQKIREDLESYFGELQKLGEFPADRAAREEYAKKQQKIADKYKKPLDELNQVQQTLQKFQQPYTMNGFVWLLLGAPPKESAER